MHYFYFSIFYRTNTHKLTHTSDGKRVKVLRLHVQAERGAVFDS